MLVLVPEIGDSVSVKLSGVESSTVNLNSDTGDIEVSDFKDLGAAALYLSSDEGKIVVDGKEYKGQYNYSPEVPASEAADEAADQGEAAAEAAEAAEAAAGVEGEPDEDNVEPGIVTGATIVAQTDTGSITIK